MNSMVTDASQRLRAESLTVSGCTRGAWVGASSQTQAARIDRRMSFGNIASGQERSQDGSGGGKMLLERRNEVDVDSEYMC